VKTTRDIDTAFLSVRPSVRLSLCMSDNCNGGTAVAAPPPSGLATLPSVGAVP